MEVDAIATGPIIDHPHSNVTATPNQTTNDLDQLGRDTSTNQNTRTGLLRLPAELRNRIYEMLLEHHFDFVARIPLSPLHYSVHEEPAFCSTCRQIQVEGLSIFYGEFVDVQRYDGEAKAWTTLSFEEVWRLRPKGGKERWYARQTQVKRPAARIVL